MRQIDSSKAFCHCLVRQVARICLKNVFIGPIEMTQHIWKLLCKGTELHRSKSERRKYDVQITQDRTD